MMVSLDLLPVPPIYGGDRDPKRYQYSQIAYALAPGSYELSPSGYAWASDAQDIRAEPVVHDPAPYASAFWRNAVMAAGLLRRQSTLSMESNHTNPSSP